jgi:hypothetical protein
MRRESDETIRLVREAMGMMTGMQVQFHPVECGAFPPGLTYC